MNPSALIEVNIIRNHREYDPSLFVNRETELKAVTKEILRAQDGNILSKNVFNFWGVKGMGKTWLLRHLEYLFSFKQNNQINDIAVGHSTFALSYTFADDHENISISHIAYGLIQILLKQLEHSLSKEELHLLETCEETDALNTFIRTIKNLSDKVPLLLLDNVETVSEAIWKELEVQLIEPMAITGRVLIVVAGRRQVPSWNRFEVRRRVLETMEGQVLPFSLEATCALVEKRNPQLPGDLLFSYAGGSPQLTDAILQHLELWVDSREPILDEEWVEEHQSSLLEILKLGEEEMLRNVEPDLRPILDIISPLRFYRLEALQYMMVKQNGVEGQRPVITYLNILRSLAKTEVVWWEDNCKAYITSKVIRLLLNKRKLLEEPNKYYSQHQLSLDMYWHWTKEMPELCDEFIVEIWYHLACLSGKTNQMFLETEIRKSLEFAILHLPADRLASLKNLFLEDTELAELLGDAQKNMIMANLALPTDNNNSGEQK